MTVNLLEGLTQWRLKDRIPEERNYVIYGHNLNTLIKAPFGVVIAFPDDPKPMFNCYHSSESLPSTSYYLTHHTSIYFSNLSKPDPVEKISVAIQTEVETWDFQTDCELTASLWSTEFANAEFEQQNENLVIELNNFKVSLRCANTSRANAKANADCAKPKLEISEKVSPDLFEENKEVQQELMEATTKAEPLQSEMIEANKMTILLKQKMDESDLVKKSFQESSTKKTSQIKHQAKVEKLLKQLQVMKVGIEFQRAEAIHWVQAVHGKQYEKLEKCWHAILAHAHQ